MFQYAEAMYADVDFGNLQYINKHGCPILGMVGVRIKKVSAYFVQSKVGSRKQTIPRSFFSHPKRFGSRLVVYEYVVVCLTSPVHAHEHVHTHF